MDTRANSVLHDRAIPWATYPGMLWLGMALGLAVGQLVARQRGIDPTAFVVSGALLTVIGLLGARALFLTAYARSQPSSSSPSGGGLALYGALPAAVPAALGLAAVAQFPAGSFLDAAAISFLLGLAVTKLGCLRSGCCGGRCLVIGRGQAGARGRGGPLYRAPPQLLESILALAVLLLAALALDSRPGAAAAVAACGYAAARLFLERIRSRQSPRVLGPLRLNDACSVLVMAVGASGVALL